jgi:gas vesicle protein
MSETVSLILLVFGIIIGLIGLMVLVKYLKDKKLLNDQVVELAYQIAVTTQVILKNQEKAAQVADTVLNVLKFIKAEMTELDQTAQEELAISSVKSALKTAGLDDQLTDEQIKTVVNLGFSILNTGTSN